MGRVPIIRSVEENCRQPTMLDDRPLPATALRDHDERLINERVEVERAAEREAQVLVRLVVLWAALAVVVVAEAVDMKEVGVVAD